MSNAWLCAAAILVMIAGIVAIWQVRVAVGILAGGCWNLASLWCLMQLLTAWLGPHPSQRRVIGWLLVKFPLLYPLVFTILRRPGISLLGFGIGFTVVLLTAVTWYAGPAQQMLLGRAHGR